MLVDAFSRNIMAKCLLDKGIIVYFMPGVLLVLGSNVYSKSIYSFTNYETICAVAVNL